MNQNHSPTHLIAIIYSKHFYSSSNLRRHSAKYLPAVAIPKEFRLIDCPLPKISNGKIDYKSYEK